MQISKQDQAILKRILGLFKPYYKQMIIITVCILLSGGISILIPLLGKEIMDKGILAGSIENVVRFSAGLMLMIAITLIFEFIETKNVVTINSLMQYQLEKQAFKHLMQLDIAYFNQRNFAEIINNLGMDAENTAKISDRSTFFVVAEVFRLVGGTIGLIMISWKLTLAVAVMIPIKFTVVQYIAKKTRQAFEQEMEYKRAFASWYGDTIEGVKEVKLLGLERIKTGKFIKSRGKSLRQKSGWHSCKNSMNGQAPSLCSL